MRIEVRHAQKSDWPAVASLLAELGRPDVRGRPDERHAQEVYESYLERADATALVAEVEENVLGFVNVEYRPRLNYRTAQGWVADLVIDERRRSLGLGKALLTAAEHEAVSRGCWGIALESANWRKDAHRFYEREGWSQVALAFTKVLDGTPARL